VNALRDLRTRLAISAVNQATFPETAPTLLLRALDVEVAVSLPVVVVVVVDPKSAIKYIEPPKEWGRLC